MARAWLARASLGSVAMVRQERQEGGETSVDVVHYISSLTGQALQPWHAGHPPQEGLGPEARWQRGSHPKGGWV